MKNGSSAAAKILERFSNGAAMDSEKKCYSRIGEKITQAIKIGSNSSQ